MKLWVLKNQDSLPVKLERYPQAARELGIEVEVVDVSSISAINAGQTFSLLKEGVIVSLQDYPDAVLVICRTFGYDHFQLWAAELVQHFEQAGVVVGNNFASRSLADNKWLTHQKLVVDGVETPNTWLLSRQADQHQLLDSQQYPLILKTVFGYKGDGVFLCTTKQEVEQNLQEIDPRKTVIIQDYLPQTHGRDVRAIVVGDRVVAAMKRTAAADGFKANLGADGAGEVFTLSAKQQQMAVQATQALGLYYSGVDLLFKSDDELVVGEVNANPGLGIETITGVNVTKEICLYLQALVTNKRK
jgi:ribosomal protein S6--L-glutamate ligase